MAGPVPIIYNTNDYISGGSRSSSRNGGTPLHIRDILAEKTSDLYNNQTGLSLHAFSAPSQKIHQLTQTLVEEHYNRGCPPNTHGYIFGGYCDISDKRIIQNYWWRNRAVQYQEVVFDYTIPEAYGKLISEITTSARVLRREGIRPCFATIPPASLEKWNNHQLKERKTALLLHEGQYEAMQQRLNTVLSNVNSFICKLNVWNDMYTPYVAGTVLRTKASNDKFILSHHKMYDGVHANDKLMREWGDKFDKAIRKNRVAYRSTHHPSDLNIPLTDEIVLRFGE